MEVPQTHIILFVIIYLLPSILRHKCYKILCFTCSSLWVRMSPPGKLHLS